jgi:hypothetical protein
VAQHGATPRKQQPRGSGDNTGEQDRQRGVQEQETDGLRAQRCVTPLHDVGPDELAEDVCLLHQKRHALLGELLLLAVDVAVLLEHLRVGLLRAVLAIGTSFPHRIVEHALVAGSLALALEAIVWLLRGRGCCRGLRWSYRTKRGMIRLTARLQLKLRGEARAGAPSPRPPPAQEVLPTAFV